MGVNLTKGQNISLTKAASDGGIGKLRRIVMACGWDAKKAGLFGGKGYDLDLSAAALDSDGRVPTKADPTDLERRQNWFVWANHHAPQDGSIVFGGDNRTGRGSGDDEKITVDLELVDPRIVTIKFAVVIWQARERGGQTFGKVRNAFSRGYDADTGQELFRYDLGSDFSNETLVIFSELYRRNGDWKVRAVGEGYDPTTYQAEHGIMSPFHIEYARSGY